MIAAMARWSGVPFEIAGAPSDTLASLGRAAGVGRRARLVASTDESFVIDDRWRPIWARMLAIGLFPFGLVALLYRRRGQLTVAVQPGSSDRTTVWVTGNASRLVSAAMWRVLRELSPDAPAAVLVARARGGRWGEIRQRCERWASAHPWVFSLTCGTVVFVLSSWWTSWDIWTDVVGNAIFSVVVVGVAARLLQLWPNNRLINWHSSRQPAVRQIL
jgi:hypothetical protein